MRRLHFSTLALMAFMLPTTALAQETDPPKEAPPQQEGDRDHDRGRSNSGLREVPDHEPSRRKGFWLSGGLGAGSESFDANDGLGWSDDKGGSMAFIKLGATVSRSFLVGVEASLWAAEYQESGYDRSLGSIMVLGQWYPAPSSGLWLRGGVGWARDDLDLYGGNPGNLVTERDGTAFAVGAGFDIPVGRKISITPLVDFQMQRYESHDERIVAFGLAVTLP